jgi:hypothetical protein
MMDRQQAIDAIVAKGKTPEQAEAFLAILGSAWARRGWADGEPMGDDEAQAALEVFLGDST